MKELRENQHIPQSSLRAARLPKAQAGATTGVKNRTMCLQILPYWSRIKPGTLDPASPSLCGACTSKRGDERRGGIRALWDSTRRSLECLRVLLPAVPEGTAGMLFVLLDANTKACSEGKGRAEQRKGFRAGGSTETGGKVLPGETAPKSLRVQQGTVRNGFGRSDPIKRSGEGAGKHS